MTLLTTVYKSSLTFNMFTRNPTSTSSHAVSHHSTAPQKVHAQQNCKFMSRCSLIPEEVGHAYGRARNAVSRMVSKHCKISVATALEVRFCTCPVAGTRSCRSIILGSRIVEMGPYCSFVSVALGSQNFAARAS